MIRFGEFELESCTGQLRAGGVLTRLQPQPAKVLAILATNAGLLVTREQLRRQVWGESTFVDFEQGLNFCIRQIRAVLGDLADAPRFVETLPRRGYRFVAAVEVVDAVPAPRQRAPLRIAVMPFQSIGASTEPDYFGQGLTEELITTLTRLAPGHLRVLARATVMQCQREGIGLERLRRELRVDHVLEGNIRTLSDRVRISAELIDASDQTVIWADTYERRLTDLFAIQSEVASRVARSLLSELAPGAPVPRPKSATTSPAHEAYLKGRFFWHKMTAESVLASSRYFEEAIATDPNYALAHAGLADCYAQMGSFRVALMPAPMAFAKAKPIAERALQLNDGLPEAHNALALLKCWYELDWSGAGQGFRRALDLDPDNVGHAPWYATYLMVIGEPEKALAEISRAREIDPLSPILNTYVGVIQMHAGQPDLAVRQLWQTISLDPSYYRSYLFLGCSYRDLGDYGQALSALREAQARAPENLEVIAYSAQIQAVTGDRKSAEAGIGRLFEICDSRYDPAILVAAVQAALGNNDEAFKWLEQAIENRASPIYLLSLREFRYLRDDPRYRSCLLRVGLPPSPITFVTGS